MGGVVDLEAAEVPADDKETAVAKLRKARRDGHHEETDLQQWRLTFRARRPSKCSKQAPERQDP
jgi:hypothetical protein